MRPIHSFQFRVISCFSLRSKKFTQNVSFPSVAATSTSRFRDSFSAFQGEQKKSKNIYKYILKSP